MLTKEEEDAKLRWPFAIAVVHATPVETFAWSWLRLVLHKSMKKIVKHFYDAMFLSLESGSLTSLSRLICVFSCKEIRKKQLVYPFASLSASWKLNWCYGNYENEAPPNPVDKVALH